MNPKLLMLTALQSRPRGKVAGSYATINTGNNSCILYCDLGSDFIYGEGRESLLASRRISTSLPYSIPEWGQIRDMDCSGLMERAIRNIVADSDDDDYDYDDEGDDDGGDDVSYVPEAVSSYRIDTVSHGTLTYPEWRALSQEEKASTMFLHIMQYTGNEGVHIAGNAKFVSALSDTYMLLFSPSVSMEGSPVVSIATQQPVTVSSVQWVRVRAGEDITIPANTIIKFVYGSACVTDIAGGMSGFIHRIGSRQAAEVMESARCSALILSVAGKAKRLAEENMARLIRRGEDFRLPDYVLSCDDESTVAACLDNLQQNAPTPTWRRLFSFVNTLPVSHRLQYIRWMRVTSIGGEVSYLSSCVQQAMTMAMSTNSSNGTVGTSIPIPPGLFGSRMNGASPTAVAFDDIFQGN